MCISHIWWLPNEKPLYMGKCDFYFSIFDRTKQEDEWVIYLKLFGARLFEKVLLLHKESGEISRQPLALPLLKLLAFLEH